MKGVIIFVFGAVCGASGALLWLQKDYKKRLEKMEEEYFSRSEEGKNSENSTENGGESSEKSDGGASDGASELRRVEENQRVLVGLSDKYGYTNNGSEGGKTTGTEASLTRDNVVNYSDFSRKNEEKSVSPRNSKSGTGPESDEIYEISEEDFEFSRAEYPKKCVKFFAENDVFIDFDGTVIDTLINGTGEWSENLKRYMPEKMWIRDDKYGCDYEISVVDDEYISDDFDGQEGV